jgi:hypothetical protein
VVKKLVQFFQQWRFTGVVFTHSSFPGTFRLSQVHVDSGDAPDILISFRWTADKSKNGTAGMLPVDKSNYGPGQGHHGSLSRFDMHNILIAAGPDLRNGLVSTMPSGNIDVAPTVLWLLGMKSKSSMDGRVLSEALKSPGPSLKSTKPYRLSTSVVSGAHTWRQYLSCAQVNGVDYFDEGNGEQEPIKER